MNFSTIRTKAQDLLNACQIFSAPIPLDRVAAYLDLKLQPAVMDESTSGMLVIQHGKGVIGFNHQEVGYRQRFTVAHEIGHFILHYSEDNIFLDKKPSLFMRSKNTSREETEANVFAANLLMPETMVRNEVEQWGIISEGVIEEIAAKFQVSSIAMSYRLQNLGIIE